MMKYILTLFLLSACATAPVRKSPLVLLTDFGVKDGAVSAMKGVAYTVDPSLVISDLTHEVPPYNIWEAAYRIQQAYRYWPAGTVFVTVVDPGVGSARKPIVAQTQSGYYFVGPDNGHLTLIAQDLAVARTIDETKHRRAGSEASYTFHGRDLFVLVGAQLASGALKFADVGPKMDTPLIQMPSQLPQFKDKELRAQIPVLDSNYGNVWTNIPKDFFAASFPAAKKFHVRIFDGERKVFEGTLPLAKTFNDVPAGQPLLYFNSLLNVAVALNQANFAAKHHLGSGPGWTIRIQAR